MPKSSIAMRTPRSARAMRRRGRRLGVDHQHRLGDLDREVPRFQGGLFQGLANVIDQHVVVKLARADVHGHANRAAPVVPGLDLATSLLEDKASHVDDEIGGLQDRDELHGSDHPALGMAPAQESLDISWQAALEINDWLVDEEEVPLGEGLGQVRLHRQLLFDHLVHLGLEEDVAVLAH